MSHHAGKIAGTRWSPVQYGKFSDHRLRPAIELLQRVPLETPKLVYDLGCGGGDVTKLISEQWPSARVVGVDASPEMLEKARQLSSEISWRLADIANWSADGQADLIYSNAALHWLPDHLELFPRLMGYLSSRGYLAVQVPLSWDLPSHRLMRETLEDCRSTGEPLGGPALKESLDRKWVEDADFYYDTLLEGSARLDIWETEYLQVLSGENAVYQWVEATGLRPILNGLNTAEKKIFIPEYQARLNRVYPARADGSVLYPFRRLFIVAEAK